MKYVKSQTICMCVEDVCRYYAGIQINSNKSTNQMQQLLQFIT